MKKHLPEHRSRSGTGPCSALSGVGLGWVLDANSASRPYHHLLHCEKHWNTTGLPLLLAWNLWRGYKYSSEFFIFLFLFLFFLNNLDANPHCPYTDSGPDSAPAEVSEDNVKEKAAHVFANSLFKKNKTKKTLKMLIWKNCAGNM